MGVHLLVWRVRLPRAQTAALLKIFALVYVLALGSAALPQLQPVAPANAAQLLHFTVFFVLVALAYTSFYSLLEHNSPSLAMVSAIARAGPAGCAREELEQAVGRDAIVEQRLLAATGNGLLQRNEDCWVLTWKGRVFAAVFDAAVSFYRLDQAG